MAAVYVYGYMNKNLGDDLFFYTLVRSFPQHQFIFSSPQIDFLRQQKNVLIVSNKLLLFINRVIIHFFKCDAIAHLILHYWADAFIWIGGSIFIEHNNYENKLSLRKKIFQIKNIKKYIIGCNFGPYKSEYFFEQYSRIIEKSNFVCFRDNYSYSLFKGESDKIQYAPDIVFNYKQNQTEGDFPKTFVISIMDLNRFFENRADENAFFNNLILFIKDLCNRGKQITLMSFCINEGDEIYAKKIYETLDGYNHLIIIKTYNGSNLEEMLNYMKSAEYIVAMRYHAMILGWNFEVPVFPIIYSDKMLNVIEDFEFNGNYCRIEDFAKKSLDFIYFNYKEKRLLSNIQEIREKARNNFSFFSEIN